MSVTNDGITLVLIISPRASRDEMAGLLGDAIKVRLQAPPIDGRANAALIDLLAHRLDVARGAIEIVSGETARRKIVHVAGITVEQALSRLAIG